MLTHSDTSLRRAGQASLAGAAVLTVGALVTQVVQASTTVSDDRWSYPWPAGTSAWISLLWAFAQALVLVGVLALGNHRLAGDGRAARAGAGLAAAGTALILAGHLGSIAVRNETVDDTAAQIVGAVYAVGTLLSAVGFLLLGRGVMRAGGWTDWRRYAPLAVGVAAVALLGLQVTPALPTGVAVYSLCLAAVGFALWTEASGTARAVVET